MSPACSSNGQALELLVHNAAHVGEHLVFVTIDEQLEPDDLTQFELSGCRVRLWPFGDNQAFGRICAVSVEGDCVNLQLDTGRIEFQLLETSVVKGPHPALPTDLERIG